jgi:hypothetical protein
MHEFLYNFSVESWQREQFERGFHQRFPVVIRQSLGRTCQAILFIRLA